jgi:hypothetical protein
MAFKYRMYLFLHYTVRGVLVSVFRLLNTLHMKCVFVKSLQPDTNIYRGADKSLARPGRKQATALEDFDFHVSYL